ncbi:MAG: hypothetical protein K6U02_04725 [Firmicutes bacterium]|nr:hypothetical protein [Bacillota bacterium]
MNVTTATGRYTYQFQGSGPTVRGGRYESARDFLFLVMDESGWLYRIPVRVPDTLVAPAAELLQRAETQLRAGLEKFRPRQNTPYPELDAHFALAPEP